MPLFKISFNSSKADKKSRDKHALPPPRSQQQYQTPPLLTPELSHAPSLPSFISSATSDSTSSHADSSNSAGQFAAFYTELVDASTPFADLSDSRLKVIVVGGGFGGLATAIACARQGFSVTVLERGNISHHGDLLTVGANAARILTRWGLFDELWRHSAKGGYWLLKDEEGKVLREEDIRQFPALFGAPVLHAHRAQLLGVLGIEARLLGVQIHTNTPVIDYRDSHKTPSVTVIHNEVEEVLFADVIVVSDGIHSPARSLLADQLHNPASPIVDGIHGNGISTSDYSVHRGLTSSAAVRANPRTAYLLDGCVRTWLGKDAHLLVAPLDQGRQLSFSFIHFDPRAQATTNWRDRRDVGDVLRLMEGWDPSAVEAVKAFKTCLNWKINEGPPAQDWVTKGGKIVMIGDSVHALAPSSFQGGSQAIEDGATLAICLALSGGGSRDVSRALRTFATIRLPRVTEAQETGIEQRKLWHSYSTNHSPHALDLLISRAYDHDAELHAMSHFERTAQRVEPSFRVSPNVKSACLDKLEVGKEAVPRALFATVQRPTR